MTVESMALVGKEEGKGDWVWWNLELVGGRPFREAFTIETLLQQRGETC